MKAVAAAFIEIKTVKFSKKVLNLKSAIDYQKINGRIKLSKVNCTASLPTGASWPLSGGCPLLLLPLTPRTLLLQVQRTLFSYWPWLTVRSFFKQLVTFRDMGCFNYFCRACWELQHGTGLPHHRPIMRNTRGGGNMDRSSLASTFKDSCRRLLM